MKYIALVVFLFSIQTMLFAQINNPLSQFSTLTSQKIIYKMKTFKSTAEANSFYLKLNAQQKDIICNINRMDNIHLVNKKSFWVPDAFDSANNLYAPFEQFDNSLAAIPQVMLISLRQQAYALYEYGKLIRWGPVSTGKKSTPSPTGLHYMTFKKKIKRSTVNNSWIMPWYFNIDVNRGIAIHQYQLPGYPASHGCIRLLEQDAQFIYNWGQQWKYKGDELVKKGTPVILFGKNQFDQALFNPNHENKISQNEQEEIANYLLNLEQ